MEGKPLVVWGDGEQSRDFTFVSDIVQGCLRALEAGRDGSVYNIGGEAADLERDSGSHAPDHREIPGSQLPAGSEGGRAPHRGQPGKNQKRNWATIRRFP